MNVKKNLEKEANISHWKMAQKVQDRRYGEVWQESGVPALPRRSTATNLRQGPQKIPGKIAWDFFAFAALTLDPG